MNREIFDKLMDTLWFQPASTDKLEDFIYKAYQDSSDKTLFLTTGMSELMEFALAITDCLRQRKDMQTLRTAVLEEMADAMATVNLMKRLLNIDEMELRKAMSIKAVRYIADNGLEQQQTDLLQNGSTATIYRLYKQYKGQVQQNPAQTAPVRLLTTSSAANYIVKQLKNLMLIQRYEATSTNSVYLKFDYGVANSLRISDHAGKKHLEYRYNLILNQTEPAYSDCSGGYPRWYYPASEIDQLITDIIEQKRQRMNSYKDYASIMESARLRHANDKKGFWHTAKEVKGSGNKQPETFWAMPDKPAEGQNG